MAKGNAKNNSSVIVSPPQPRSLRSRKRESDEISEPDATHYHHQDTEGTNTAVDATLLESHHSPLQESTVNVSEEREETTVTHHNGDSHLEEKRTEDDANTSGNDKEEISAKDGNASPSQTCTDPQLQVSEQGDTLEEQLGAKEKQGASQEEPGKVYMADVNEVKKEVTAGMPPKKKRRMGMCGLTGRERSHFLQIQKRENGQNGAENVENQSAEPEDQEEIMSSSPSLSTPVGGVTENDEAEINLGSSCYGGDERVETEVHIGDPTSDGTSDKLIQDPGCSEGKTCQVEGDTLPDLEQSGDIRSDPPAEKEEEKLLGNQEQQQQGGTAEIVAQEQKQDGSGTVDQSPAVTSSNPTKNEETESCCAIEAALPEVNIVTRDERQEELMTDAGDGDGADAGDSSIDTRAGAFSAVEPCKALLGPTSSGRKDDEDPDKEPAAGPPVNVEPTPTHTRDTTEPLGSGCLDYVSDSQLNTIVLSEEVMEKKEGLVSPHHEDATDLVRGLITELSSLNYKVMAAHRELESLRRGSKSARRSTR